MKTVKFLAITAFATLALTNCSDDNTKVDIPIAVNEEELITTLTVTLTNDKDEKDIVTLYYQDLDGAEGAGEEKIEVSGPLTLGAKYNGEIEFLNESGKEVEDITEEVKEEGDEHQIFYSIKKDIASSVTYTDKDSNDKPIGLEFILTASETAVADGGIVVTLKHEPKKDAEGVEDGDIKNAGGETDIEVSFDVAVEGK